jgi:Bacterial mobilisation protein (MobC)
MDDQMVRREAPSAANGAARLHRVDGGRRHAVTVRLDDAEYRSILDRAAEYKLSIQRFLVSCALARRAPAPTPPRGTTPPRIPSPVIAELAGLKRLTANLANNINQIVRALNSGGTPDASIAAAADAVRRVMLRLDSVLTGMTAEHPARPPARPVPDQAVRGSPRTIPETSS